MPRRFPFRSSAAAVVLLCAIGCEPVTNVIRLEPAPAADSLIFVVAGRDGLPVGSGAYGFSVFACGSQLAFWTIAAGGGRSLPSRIVYGQPIPGFATRTGPRPLVPGCYEAAMTDARSVQFDVDAQGRIHPH